MNADVAVQVEVSACHANAHLCQVRFYVDNWQSTAVGPSGPLYAVILYEDSARPKWGYWRIKRWSWPHTWRRRFAVPLRRLARQGLVQPGVLRGKVDVTVCYPDVTRYGHLPNWAYPSCSTMQSTPFTLELARE